MTSAQGYDTCQLENEVRKTCGAQSVPVTACAPALVTMVSTFSCRTICIIAIATPEWTGPVRMSTFSPAISLLTFAGAQLAPVLGGGELHRVGDVVAQRRIGSGVRKQEADLQPGAGCGPEAAGEQGGAGGCTEERTSGERHATSRGP